MNEHCLIFTTNRFQFAPHCAVCYCMCTLFYANIIFLLLLLHLIPTFPSFYIFLLSTFPFADLRYYFTHMCALVTIGNRTKIFVWCTLSFIIHRIDFYLLHFLMRKKKVLNALYTNKWWLFVLCSLCLLPLTSRNHFLLFYLSLTRVSIFMRFELCRRRRLS